MYESDEGIAHFAAMLIDAWRKIADDEACKDYYRLLLEVTCEGSRTLRVCEYLAEKALADKRAVIHSGVRGITVANGSGEPITSDEEMATRFLNEMFAGEKIDAQGTFFAVHLGGGQEGRVRFLNLIVNFYGETT
jgi:hypothetical protein